MEETARRDLRAYSKCLVIGGYSIVFDNSVGISVKLDDFFTAEYKWVKKTNEYDILITPRQFPQQEPCVFFIEEAKNTQKNRFVETPLRVSLDYLSKKYPEKYQELFNGGSLRIETLQTQGFINKKHISYDKQKQFCSYNESIEQCEKTGIGSSACIIVILVKTMFKIFDCDEKIDEIHLVSQISNSIAQDKIGSGFDITTSTYGTNLFSRVSKKDIESLVKSYKGQNFGIFEKKFKEVLANGVKSKPIEGFDDQYEVIMVNWSVGFDTRIAVRKVLGFLKDNNEAKIDFIKNSNQMTIVLKNIFSEKVEIENLRKINFEYRCLMKRLGMDSGVDIEPDMASFLIDFFLEKNENLLFGVCPGAGGYDDIAFIVRKGHKLDTIEDMRSLKISLEDQKITSKFSVLNHFSIDQQTLEDQISQIDINFR